MSDNKIGTQAEEIQKFHELYKEGVITETEFNKKKEEIMSGEYHKQVQSTSSLDIKNLMSNKKVIIPLAVILVCLVGFLVWDNVLFGNDKVAYDLMVKGANRFNYPSSVRIESGVVVDGSLFANISAENALGKRSTDCYWISDDGYIMESNSSGCLGVNYQTLHIKKINKKLKSHFKDE